MKITIILPAGYLQVCAIGLAQKVTPTKKDAPLAKVFKEIKEQTGYRFFYLSQQMEEAMKVTIQMKNASLEEVLKLCFKEQPFGYEIKENVIIIKHKSLTVTEINREPEMSGSILDETIVIAYGTGSRRFTTGNIATVKAADIEKQPVQNPLLA